MAEKLVSTEPSTGAELWSGEVGDAAADTGSNSGNTFPSHYDTLGRV